MKHLGDITKINGYEIPIVDCICGGSPCQDLSVAGARQGLKAERSGLFMEQIRIIKEMREHDRRNKGSDELIRPRFMLWENVEGAFSSPGKDHKGEDFQAVLTEIIKVAEPTAPDVPLPEKGKWSKSGYLYDDMGRWSVAWQSHDAQWFGVPQRRKRICVLADFNGIEAGRILFDAKLERQTEDGKPLSLVRHLGTEPRPEVSALKESVSGNTTESGKEGKGTSGEVKNSLGKTIGINGDIAGTLDANYYKGCGERQGVERDVVCSYTLKVRGGREVDSLGKRAGKGALVQEKLSGTLGVSQDQTLICLRNEDAEQRTYRKQSHPRSADEGQGWETTDTNDSLNVYDNSETRTPTLILENHPADSRVKINEDGIVQTLSSRMGTGGGNVPMVLEPDAVCIGNGQANQLYESDKVGALNCMHDKQNIVTYGLDRASFNQGKNAKYDFAIDEEKIGAQVAKGPGAVCSSIVRRLTPLEAERLQGFPDNWTDIGAWTDSKGKLHKESSDSARYKALGNSIAVGYANNKSGYWCNLARRICAQYERQITMGSLFDGIGGFPLAFSACGAIPVWASEIEEFPIAVTKVRFPDEQ